MSTNAAAKAETSIGREMGRANEALASRSRDHDRRHSLLNISGDSATSSLLTGARGCRRLPRSGSRAPGALIRAPPRSTIRATRTLRITHADGLDRAFSKRAKESQSHLCWTMCKTLAAVQVRPCQPETGRTTRKSPMSSRRVSRFVAGEPAAAAGGGESLSAAGVLIAISTGSALK